MLFVKVLSTKELWSTFFQTDINKLGYDRDLDLTYGISVIYNVNSTTITINKSRANMDDIQLYYASPIHNYAGNIIQVIDSTSIIEKPNSLLNNLTALISQHWPAK